MFASASAPRIPNEGLDELACLSFLDKFYNSGHDTSLTLNVCDLQGVLYGLYLKENKDKILALILHNQETEFSMEICRILSEHQEITSLMNSHFIIHGLDVGEITYQADLMDIFGKFYSLLPCVDMVKRKQPAVVFVAAIDMDLEICSTLRDIPSLQNMYISMSLLVDSLFNDHSNKHVEQEQSNDIGEESGYEDFQQKMYEWMGNRDYDRFEASELLNLKEKISFALFGMPVEESGYSEKQKEEAEKMYNIILETNNEYSEYEDQVVMAILYNCLVPLDAESKQQFSPVPIFILRKCTSSPDIACRMIIDHTRRVYESWNSYLEDNKFCKCLMVVPEDGRYTEDDNGRVKLQKVESPACSVGQTVLKVTDITTSVLGIGSTGVMVAAAVPAITVAPVAILTAAAVGAGVGVYSIGRSIGTLIDRGLHKQSLKVTEAESRAAYLNIAAGVAGFAGAGANAAVSQLASNGVTIGTSARIAVNTLGVANIGISGLAVSNSAVEIFMRWWIDDEPPSALSVLQLSTSILFFGHAVYNFKSAGTIIEESQTTTLQKFKDSLSSNKQRKIFRKIELETMRLNGGNLEKGRADIISALTKLKNKDEVFSFLSRNNKKFNELGVKFSAKGGQINFNGVVLDLVEISSMSWKDSCAFFKDLPKSAQDVASVETGPINFSLDAVLTMDSAVTFLKLIVGPLSLRDKLYIILRKVIDYLNIHEAHFKLIDILTGIFPNGHFYLAMAKMILSFVQKKVEQLQEKIDADNLDGMDRALWKYFKNLDDAEKKLGLIQHVCDTMLLAFQNNTAYIEDLLQFSIDWVMNAYMEHSDVNERNATVQQGRKKDKIVTCKECKGTYYGI